MKKNGTSRSYFAAMPSMSGWSGAGSACSRPSTSDENSRIERSAVAAGMLAVLVALGAVRVAVGDLVRRGARIARLGLCRVRVRSPRANCLHALLIPEVSCLDDFVPRVCRVPMATCVRRLHQASPLHRVEGRDLLCLYRARPAMAIRLTRALPKLPASHDPLCLLDRA